MNTLEQAAREFCEADNEITRLRVMWRNLKKDHKGEHFCPVPNYMSDPSTWCESCQEYPMADYKIALRNRQRAKRRMRTRYAVILKNETQRKETN